MRMPIKLLLTEVNDAVPVSGTKDTYQTLSGIYFNAVTLFGKIARIKDGAKTEDVPSFSILNEDGSVELKCRPSKFDWVMLERIKKISVKSESSSATDFRTDVAVEVQGRYSTGEKDGRKWKILDIDAINIIKDDQLEDFRNWWYVTLIAQRSLPLPKSSYAYIVAKDILKMPIREEGDSFRIDSKKESAPSVVSVPEKVEVKTQPKAVSTPKEVPKSKVTTPKEPVKEPIKEPIKDHPKVTEPKKTEPSPPKSGKTTELDPETIKSAVIEIIKRKPTTPKDIVAELKIEMSKLMLILSELRAKDSHVQIKFANSQTVFSYN